MRRLAILAIVAALTLSACSQAGDNPSVSSGDGSISSITIGSSDTLAPSLAFPAGETFSRPQAKVVWHGDGAALVDNQPLLLDIYGVSLTDGTEVINTYDGLPRSYALAPEVIGDQLYEILIHENVGTRVLLIAPPPGEDATEPPVALVVDVLSDRAVGTATPARDDMPPVAVSVTGEPTITIPAHLTEPTDLKVATLIQGNGPQVKQGSFVMVNYKAVRWKDGSEFENSWPTDHAPFQTQIGTGQVIQGWDEALLDQTAGSQVEFVVPPAYGYASEGTLVFVVDILDVWTPSTP